jgi:hypothetical protein
MSYPGGIAAKHGERYEAQWTVNCVLDMLRGNAESIDLEPIGPDGVGTEFVLGRKGKREYHQVKRRGSGRWSLTALKAEGVLTAFSAKLQAGAVTHFVSEQDANELRVLSERARNADDLADFLRHLGGDTWTQNFRTLASHMSLPEPETFSALRRIYVTVIDEEKLTTLNEAWVEPLIDAVPADVLADLADLVRNSVPGRLDTPDVWKVLSDKYGKTRRMWAEDEGLHALVHELNETYLNPLLGVRLTPPLDRPQVAEVRASLERDDLDGVLLTGSAGSGKSDVLLQTISDAKRNSWAVLCFRADRLEPTPTASGVGGQLGLPGSPVGVLAAIAQQRPSLLVIDQLDAVSLASGRVTGLWEALYTLICQARSTPQMKVLIACRQFDVDNDHRMRALTSDEHDLAALPLPSLDKEQVNIAVRAMGLDPAKLDDRKRTLLSVPLHLTLLEAIAGESDPLDFHTISDLFARFWRRKQRDADEHAGREVKWSSVIAAATDYMSDHLRLSVPASQFDSAGLLSDADALASENVLVPDAGAYRFFHESFFDYAFARLYLSSGKTIGDLLPADDQDLFRRAQVRQLLTQQRDTDYNSYVGALSELLTRDDIRFHIKQLTLTWLASVPEPQGNELAVLASILKTSDADDPRRILIWRVFGQPAWFDLALSEGALDRWLADPEPTTIDMAVQILSTVVNERPDDVLKLLRSHDDGGAYWRDRISYVVRFADVQSRRGLFDLLLDVLNRDAFLAGADHDAWLYGHALPEAQPEWAAELMKTLLMRATARARGDGEAHALYDASPLQHEYSAIEFVSKLGDTHPTVLLSVALPFMLDVIDSTLEDGTQSREEMADRLPVDRVWPYRLTDETYTFSDTLLAVVRQTLGDVAAKEPAAFMAWAEKLRARRDETSQYLLYYGLLGNPSEFATFAAAVLLDGLWRYRVEEKGDGFWVTHRLLAAIAPHLSTERLAELEGAILGFTTSYERTPHGARGRGRAELWLLSGLATGAISATAEKRLRELERKFPETKPEPPPGIIGGAITSPISVDSARRMSDADWLRAIAKHRERWEDKRSMDLVGGADQFANVLQELTQEQPERFAKLGLEMPPDTLETYIEHLLIGLLQPSGDTAPASLESVVKLCQYVAQLPDSPGARWLPRLVSGYAEDAIPADVLELVAQVATDNPDPQQDIWKVDAGGGKHYYGGDILGAGMNSARGAAAEAIARLVVVDESRVTLLAPAIAKLSNDPIAAVKACAAEAVYALMRWRRDEAISDLLALVDGPDRLLATRSMQQLMMAAIATHWTHVRPIVERMLASDEEEVRDAGGALASVAGLDETDAGDLLTSVLGDADARIRRGVAKVLAARAVSSRYRERCAAGLRKLFDDEDAGVREEAAKVFWRVQDRQLAELDAVSYAFLSSAAFQGNHQHFLHALNVSTADVIDLVLATADRMVSAYGEQLGDLRGRIGGDSRDLSNLLLRVLGTMDADRAKTNRALDMLDLMLGAGAWGVTEALETVER